MCVVTIKIITLAFIAFSKLVENRWKFGMFLLQKLPSAWLCGVRPQSISEDTCRVSVPYKWLSQNPFRSTYFACQAMAAEMSTGLLAMGHIYKRNPPISMLVTGMQAEFLKKAASVTTFTCTQGDDIRQAIDETAVNGHGTNCSIVSEGRNESGELISRFTIEWSFKAKR